MEKFKVLEKEMKIKAFSKEGLNQTTKLDPKMKEKIELANWINSTVDRLNTQIDAYEAEAETIYLTQKKGKKLESTKQERCDLLISTVEKHKNHIQKLEAILRLMQNDQVSNEQVCLTTSQFQIFIQLGIPA
jgi:CCR4-NOT transcription complex subunit 3